MAWIWAVVGIVALVGVLSFTPYPGHCNVEVTSQVFEVPAIITQYFQITGTSAQTTGQSTILDWSAWLAGFAPPALQGEFRLVLSSDSGQSATLSSGEILPTLQGGIATDSATLAYVPAGAHVFSAILTENGDTVASSSTSLQVSC